MVVTVQQGDGGSGARAKRPWWHVGRALGGGKFAAAGAAERMVVMSGDVRVDEWQFPDILSLHRTGIPASFVQQTLTGRAGLGVMVAHLRDLLGSWVWALVIWMAFLRTGFASTRHASRAWRRGRWVGGGRFGGVLGMLIEPGLQLSKLRLKLKQLLLLVGKLLLLQGQDVQEHTDELTDC
jgi:hypothetical protein